MDSKRIQPSNNGQSPERNEVLLGWQGKDTPHGNQDTDICDGGAGLDSGHTSWETELNIP
jgi:hypothetical protein